MQREAEEIDFQFRRIFDYDTVLQTLRNAAIFHAASDDFSPPREAFMPRMDDQIVYVGCFAGNPLIMENYCGLWAFFPTSAIRWNVHTCLLPSAWGYAAEATRGMLSWLWVNQPVERIITEVPEYNRLALKLAKDVGMEVIGVDRQSIRKHGKLHDQILLGLSKCQSYPVSAPSSAAS